MATLPSDARPKPAAHSQFPRSASDVKIEYAWGGTLAITIEGLPFLAGVAPNILSARLFRPRVRQRRSTQAS